MVDFISLIDVSPALLSLFGEIVNPMNMQMPLGTMPMNAMPMNVQMPLGTMPLGTVPFVKVQ